MVYTNQSDEVKNFRNQAIGNIIQQFNNLQSDVYGHFHRSQTTLRIARQNLYMSASNFPYYRLEKDTTRKELTALLGSIIYNIIDPTVDYVQKTSMDKFFMFNSDTAPNVEQAFSTADSQLNALATMNCSDSTVSSRKLMSEYSDFIFAINNCTRVIFQKYRAPINEFTRVHFIALPLINRLNRDLNACTSILNRVGVEACIIEYLKNNCQEENCKVNPTILAVKDQTEKMVKDGRTEYDECLQKAKEFLPANPSFLREENCNLAL
ncbi:hypothetical protein PVAND_006656 [Polypedilum vanderplanki]|uniref:Uncharacterized protein n=1 Tax=Polypedilum vanderplanki TaxID=319348 RepID=A0A9J6C3X5_POLVA|nr:hypothetical protein PVAND_006656 [Polypedilum vanderplanki]